MFGIDGRLVLLNTKDGIVKGEKKVLLPLLALAICLRTEGAEIVEGRHTYVASEYVQPAEPEVRTHLEWFRDQKLGLMIHFGIYSQMGITESWPLVDAEADWSRLLVDWNDGDAFKREYVSMNKSFNPVRLKPEVWADFAARTGFKYLVFTAKHHDGFCLYDSKYTDYKVTAADCPFSCNRYADIVRCVFDAFREKGLGISLYFSKPDWHHPDYWDNCGIGYRTTRMPSYDVKADSARWGRFRVYTRNQILELISNYGKIDVLWLDGGQVQRKNGLDIGIEEIVAEARKIQPWLIAADRTAGGTCENVVTPEQEVPAEALNVPWESCITMGTGFSYRYDDTYKSVRELVHLLVNVVAKGGNLALNVAPAPDGRIPRPAVERMEALGAWLNKNGEAIYRTRAEAPYCSSGYGGSVAFTARGRNTYAIRLWNEGQYEVRRIFLPIRNPQTIRKLTHLGSGRKILFEIRDNGIAFVLPDDISADSFADAFCCERNMD